MPISEALLSKQERKEREGERDNNKNEILQKVSQVIQSSADSLYRRIRHHSIIVDELKLPTFVFPLYKVKRSWVDIGLDDPPLPSEFTQ